MVERKTKRAEKEKERKTTKKVTKKVSKKEAEEKKTKVINASSPKKIAIKTTERSAKKDDFLQKNPSGKDEKIPTWLIILFSFSLAFLLFSIYKAFIYWKGYNEIQQNVPVEYFQIEEEPQPQEVQEEYIIADEPENIEYQDIENNSIDENISVQPENENLSFDVASDMQVIQDFYSYMINNQVDEMNTLVDTPLKKTNTWANHWGKKNIWIFTNHLNENVSLDNITYVEWSENAQKHTRKYGYTFKYTIDSWESFTENWEVTLYTRNWKTLFSALECKTDWCSHSPFFWPQNYNLN